ncbi:hypothetical protein FSP39_015649 [Pinctada imbricata]|uniref:asparaginase n=1 Tax=Pinctada imbricata TaxID=66713 RepID=A0AA89C3L6_PINIB|nr:hypothetical protein FSP39_015649 [Pinctada imbricata]
MSQVSDVAETENQAEAIAKAKAADSEVEPVSRVLVLYTGGTIGMKSNPNGVYEPKENYLLNELKKLPMFHDKEYADSQNFDNEDTLAMPYHRGKRILYLVKEYVPLLDSSNMMMKDWAHIATDISDHYTEYDGFVVLHGTDTMAYTASALSFMCENLGKPIILTGSQIPIFEVRSDGRDNFLSALIIAGQYCIPEVLLCFDNKILRGNRSIKYDAGSLSAFVSPNLPPIVSLEIRITVDWPAIFRGGETEKFQVFTRMCENVGLIRLFPGITSQTVRGFLRPPMQGVILQTYGAGNAPDNRPDLHQVFKEASNIGVIIINISQCPRGNVSTSYATGKALMDCGILCGGDMTTEAALTKLSYILGKEEWDIDKKRKMMTRNLRGEMTVVRNETISIMDFELIDSVAKCLSISSTEEVNKLRDALYPNLTCAAAMAGDVQALQKLKESGADFSLPNQDGRTALHVACREGHYPVVQYLLHNGVSVHAKDHQGLTPLMDAINGKHENVITLLVKTGSVVTLHTVNQAIELCRAAALEEMDTLQAWKAAGVDFNVADYDKRTPLHVAVACLKLKAVEFLLDSGACWRVQDIFGNSAESFASDKGYTEVLELIAKAKTAAR